MEVLDLRCPGCGAACPMAQANCDYCGRPLVISSFSSLAGLGPGDIRKYTDSYKDRLAAGQESSLSTALGICYLKLGLFGEANEAFDSAIREEVDNSEVFFYAAAAALGGKRAFITPLADIRRAETLLSAAVRLEPRGAYFQLLAYLAYDYYERKFLNREPNYRELVAEAEARGVTAADNELLLEVLGVETLGIPVSTASHPGKGHQ